MMFSLRVSVAVSSALVVSLLGYWSAPPAALACGVKAKFQPSRVKRAVRAQTARAPEATGPRDGRAPERAGGSATDREAVRAGGEDSPRTAAARETAATPSRGTRPAKPARVSRKPNVVAKVEPKPVEKPTPEETPPATEPTNESADTTATKPVDADKPKSAGRFHKQVFFGNSSATLSSNATKQLRSTARWLVSNSDKGVVVAGHANAVGNADLNKSLSGQRAQAVKDFLVEQGVDASRIETASHGSDEPAFQPASSGRNRRVELSVVGE